MSIKHPIIAVTGSSGAGTTTVMKSFAHIFRREGLNAQVVEGDAFHRYDRDADARAREGPTTAAGTPFSHFGPESEPADGTRQALREYARDRPAAGCGDYIHDASKRRSMGGAPGTFTAWQPMARRHRPAVLRRPARRLRRRRGSTSRSTRTCWSASCRSSISSGSRSCTATRRCAATRQEAVIDTILRRMPDYVNYICPQFSRTHVNFQRVPTVDTSNPFIAKRHPHAPTSRWW